MIINTQTIKKSGGGRGTYQVEAGFLSGYNELIRPSLHTPAVTMFVPSDNPADYTKVDYLSFNGSQVLWLPFTLSATNKYLLDIDLQNGATGISAWNQSGKSSSLISHRNSTNISCGGNSTTYTGRGKFGQDYATGKAYLYGVEYNDTTNQGKPNYAPYEIGCHYESGVEYYHITGDLYGLEVWDNNSYVYQYFTCYHTSSRMTGVFDSIANKFTFCDLAIPSDTSGEINLAEYLASLT